MVAFHDLVLCIGGVLAGFVIGYLLGIVRKNEAIIKALKEVEFTATQDYWNSLSKINQQLDQQRSQPGSVKPQNTL